MLHEIRNVLENYPAYRERRMRSEAIAKLLRKKYPHELESVSLQRIEDIVKDGISMDRLFRDEQQNNEAWRGNDYGDKDILEDKYQIEVLGKMI